MSRSAIIVVIDGLGAGHLGPYGNSWVGTPGLDALAAESLVIEHALSDSSNLRTSYRSYWQGRHAMCRDGDEPSLAALCRAGEIDVRLITDAPDIANHHLASDFESQVVPINLQASQAVAVEQTHSALFVEAVVSALEQLQPPFCLWVHAMGLSGPWDCPYKLRMNFVDEDDPDPTQDTVPPQFEDPNPDPDVVWGHQAAHAAQVSLIDASFALLFDAIRAVSAECDLLTVLASPRGYPLGERGVVGYSKNLLQAEQLHVPLLVRATADYEPPVRSQAIAQHADVFATIADWLDLAIDRGSTGAVSLFSAPHDARHWHSAAAIAGQRQSLRTGGWYLETQTGNGGSEQGAPKLYVKPDDRLEVNEVAQRLPEVVERMSVALRDFQRAAQQERLDQLEPLPAELRTAHV